MNCRHQLLGTFVLLLALSGWAQGQTNGLPSRYEAALRSFIVPAMVTTGQQFTVEIALENTGTETWNETFSPVWLGAHNSMNWRQSRRVSTSTPSDHIVAPGQTARFEVDCVAPGTPGVYPFAWRMLAENLTWFGPAAQTIITVTDAQNEQETSEQVTHYDFKAWQVEDGLPHNTVHAVLQARSGYLWLGTQSGLARFDGVRFKTFTPPNLPHLARTAISCLTESADGSLWIGTFDAGIFRLHENTFSHFTEKDGLVNDSTRSLFFDADNTLWIGTTNGLSRYQNGKFINFTMAGGLPHSMVRAIAADDAGNIWIGTTGNGACRIRAGKIVESLQRELPLPSIRALYLDRQSKLWFGGYGGAFYAAPGGKGQPPGPSRSDGSMSEQGLVNAPPREFISFSRQDGLPHDIVTAICQDRSGTCWVGSYGGISRLAEGKWKMELDPRGVSLDSVASIIEDREGNIWCGTKDGLVRFKPRQFFTYTQQHGLTHNNVMSVIEDAQGAIWIGTWGGGLNRLKDGVFTSYSKGNGLSLDLVLALQTDRQGQLWVGTDFEGGLNCWRQAGFEHWALPDSSLRAICAASDGTLWIGTRHSLIHWKDTVLERFTPADGLAGSTVRALCADGDGGVWIGTSEGLDHWKDGRFQRFTNGLPHVAVLALYLDAEGTLWAGTGGAGIARIRGGQAEMFGASQGLFSDEILEILEDDLQRLWMSSPRGIFHLEKKALEKDGSAIRSRAFGKADGLESIQCNGVAKPSAWKSKNGRLWFATTKGLSVIDPKVTAREIEEPPPAVIEEIIADKKPVVENGRETEKSRKKNVLIIPPGRGDMEVHYTALSLTAPERHRFQYKLDGFETEWTEAGERRVAYYNNLPPGDYAFRVKAANSDGIWNEAAASQAITLQPHFWQTRWFATLLIVCSSGAIAGTARYLTRRKLQMTLRRLEQEHAIEKERTRIAQDMHDDLGARLTQIMFLSSNAERRPDIGPEAGADVKKIADASRELAQNLDAIVWATEPRNDTLDSLATYLQDYAERYLNGSSIACLSEVQDRLPEHTLSSEARHNIFLTVKEALNNVAKHAQASEVQFALNATGSDLHIVIQDNGKGFSPGTTSSRGNGCHNMRQRIEAIGGRFEQKSDPGKGTRISFTVPLNR